MTPPVQSLAPKPAVEEARKRWERCQAHGLRVSGDVALAMVHSLLGYRGANGPSPLGTSAAQASARAHVCSRVARQLPWLHTCLPYWRSSTMSFQSLASRWRIERVKGKTIAWHIFSRKEYAKAVW